MLISLVVLGAAIYLLWRWHAGETLIAENGEAVLVREDWMLWTGLFLLAWSFLGKFITPFLLAKPDTRPTRAERGSGETIPAPSGALYVEEHGQSGSTTVVLTHGWSLDSTAWFYLKHDIAPRFRLVTWDLPGMGKSKPSSRDMINLNAFANDLRHLVATKGKGERVVLVGHSIGGMTIQTLVRNDPEFVAEYVAGIVLINTTFTNPLKTIILSRLMLAIRKPVLEPAMRLTQLLQPLAWLMAWQSYLSGWTHVANRFGFGKHVTRSQLEHVSLLTTRNSPGNQAQGNLAMFDWDATGALSTLPIPVLVIGGTMDIVTKPEASGVIAADAPDGEGALVDAVNHMGFMERSSMYNAAIEAFVAELGETDLVRQGTPPHSGLPPQPA